MNYISERQRAQERDEREREEARYWRNLGVITIGGTDNDMDGWTRRVTIRAEDEQAAMDIYCRRYSPYAHSSGAGRPYCKPARSYGRRRAGWLICQSGGWDI